MISERPIPVLSSYSVSLVLCNGCLEKLKNEIIRMARADSCRLQQPWKSILYLFKDLNSMEQSYTESHDFE